MDRHDKANSCFLQFAYVPNMLCVCVCVCVRARTHACMYVCACTHEVLYLKGVWEDEGTAPRSLPFALGGI